MNNRRAPIGKKNVSVCVVHRLQLQFSSTPPTNYRHTSHSYTPESGLNTMTLMIIDSLSSRCFSMPSPCVCKNSRCRGFLEVNGCFRYYASWRRALLRCIAATPPNFKPKCRASAEPLTWRFLFLKLNFELLVRP